MSDSVNSEIIDSGGTSAPKVPIGNRNGGVIGSFFVFICMLAAFLVAGAIFVAVVTTTAKTVLSKPEWLRKSKLVVAKKKEVDLHYTPEISMSGRTNDGNSFIYDIVLVFGFTEKQRLVDAEFARRGLEVQDLLRSFFSMQTARDLHSSNEENLKEELLERINKFLKTGKIDEVLFLRLDVN